MRIEYARLIARMELIAMRTTRAAWGDRGERVGGSSVEPVRQTNERMHTRKAAIDLEQGGVSG
jgi:hypothetical protein